MSLSTPFIRRPVATTLLTFGIAAAGMCAFFRLPESVLPQVDFPTISVEATLPGASPEVVATSVAAPLERRLGLIADVTEMTSSSTVGSARITLQFGLGRDINGAARDVQAAINAARADLPPDLPSNPTYSKVNPADPPILWLALTSDTMRSSEIDDIASTILVQRFSQVDGIGKVTVGGSSLPAVRVELNPRALNKYGIGLEDVRAALAAANAHSPKGAIEVGDRHYQIYANDQASTAAEYRSLVIAYRNGAPVRLSSVAEVIDSNANLRNAGLVNGKPAVFVILYRQPGANIIDTVDRVKAILPELRAVTPAAVDIALILDRSLTIRASLAEVERTLIIAALLVFLVVFAFLRDLRGTLVLSIAVPVSLIGTFAVMYALGYSLNNLSLMALTVGTGFVIDDAIVVLENTSRHLHAGLSRTEAAIKGAGEVGTTVLSMSLSLVAVLIPILLLRGDYVGLLLREFAVTLSVAIMGSLAVSLTTTPMMCAQLLWRQRDDRRGRLYRGSEWAFDRMLHFYARTLGWSLDHAPAVVLILLVTIGLNVYLFSIVPKGFFPEQDTGHLVGTIQADQSISFQLMRQKHAQFMSIVRKDPAVESVLGFVAGGGRTNSGFLLASLKSIAERKISADQVIDRLQSEIAAVPGASLFLWKIQDINLTGRQSNAQYQYTLQGDSLAELNTWAPKLVAELRHLPQITQVNSDQQDKALEMGLVIDRDSAARFGINVAQVDNTLYDAFGQRQVSTIYYPHKQHRVVMEVAPQYGQGPDALRDVFVSTSGGAVGGVASTNAVAGTVVAPGHQTSAASVAANAAHNLTTNALANTIHASTSTGAAVSTSVETMVPLAAFTDYNLTTTPVAVNHQGLFVATTMSFSLAPNASLSDAVSAISETMTRVGMPASIHGSFQGTARVFQESLANEPYLVLAAIVVVYIVLGVLYESYIHPVTILSTLPSAGVGAVLALMVCHTEFTIIAFVGVIVLIGIVKKNAIMMIDFALSAERTHVLASRDAIFQACLLRFRPIMMTTMAALLGALPLAIGAGEGAELRRPLGIAIVGGLILSQALTLYTTPVIYVYFDRFRLWCKHVWSGSRVERRRGK
jgi:multidrug efflux pump